MTDYIAQPQETGPDLPGMDPELLLAALMDENPEIPWTGRGGLFDQAADQIMRHRARIDYLESKLAVLQMESVSNIEQAAKLLRAADWIVHSPQAEEIPEPQVGQVWVLSNPRVEPRTIVEIGPHRYGPRNWVYVYFASKSKPIYPKWNVLKLDMDAWRKWARMSGARPVEKVEGV